MVGFAVVFGLLAVFIAQAWLNGQAERRMRSLEAQKKPVSASTIVVAKQRLQFGVELVRDQLREVPWPAEAMPEGAFARIDDLQLDGKRVVLSPIEPNEPVLTRDDEMQALERLTIRTGGWPPVVVVTQDFDANVARRCCRCGSPTFWSSRSSRSNWFAPARAS